MDRRAIALLRRCVLSSIVPPSAVYALFFLTPELRSGSDHTIPSATIESASKPRREKAIIGESRERRVIGQSGSGQVRWVEVAFRGRGGEIFLVMSGGRHDVDAGRIDYLKLWVRVSNWSV